MNLNEALKTLKNNGYQVLKEALDHDAWLIKSYEDSIGGDGPDYDDVVERAIDNIDLPDKDWINSILPKLQEKIQGLETVYCYVDDQPEVDGWKVTFRNKYGFLVKFKTAEEANNSDLDDERCNKIVDVFKEFWSDPLEWEDTIPHEDNTVEYQFSLTDTTDTEPEPPEPDYDRDYDLW